MTYFSDRNSKVSEHIRQTANSNIEPNKVKEEEKKRKQKIMAHLDKSKGAN